MNKPHAACVLVSGKSGWFVAFGQNVPRLGPFIRESQAEEIARGMNLWREEIIRYQQDVIAEALGVSRER